MSAICPGARYCHLETTFMNVVRVLYALLREMRKLVYVGARWERGYEKPYDQRTMEEHHRSLQSVRDWEQFYFSILSTMHEFADFFDDLVLVGVASWRRRLSDFDQRLSKLRSNVLDMKDMEKFVNFLTLMQPNK